MPGSRNEIEAADLATELAARGLRATRQRKAVLELLRAVQDHPTVGDIHQQLRKEHRNLGLKTVYDALESLVGAGLAGCVTDGGTPYRYEGNAEPHYHTQCRACGSLVDVPAHADGYIRGCTPLPSGFELDEIRVTLLGRCRRCRDSS